jgi:hypothetical protein
MAVPGEAERAALEIVAYGLSREPSPRSSLPVVATCNSRSGCSPSANVTISPQDSGVALATSVGVTLGVRVSSAVTVALGEGSLVTAEAVSVGRPVVAVSVGEGCPVVAVAVADGRPVVGVAVGVGSEVTRGGRPPTRSSLKFSGK